MSDITGAYLFRPANSDRENLYITGGRYSRAIGDLIESTGVQHVIIKNWKEPSLDFLKNHRDQINELSVDSPGSADISAIASLRKLERLWLWGDPKQVDFSKLNALRVFGVECRRAPVELEDAAALQELVLSGCEVRDLTWLKNVQQLQRLELNELPLRSLSGVERMTSLKELIMAKGHVASLDPLGFVGSLQSIGLTRLTQLSSIAPLVKLKQLAEVQISGCRHIQDFAILAQIESLKILRLENVGTVPTLKFLLRATSLSEIAFWEDTVIKDGDLSWLLKLPNLKIARFRNRRHYSHSEAEVQDFLLRKRRAERRKAI